MEEQMKTSVRYKLIPVGIAIIFFNVMNAVDSVQKLEPIYTVDGNVHGMDIMERIWRFSKKRTVELPWDPATPPLGKYRPTLKSGCWRDICTPRSLHHQSQ